jgi:hypothetical protein
MSDDDKSAVGNEDLKARMREALERKQSNDRGVEHADRTQGKAPDGHGPKGGKREFRRKSG